MTEQTPADTSPEEYRGGAPESDDAKGGAAELAKGLVPDDMKDDDQSTESSDPQAMADEALGGFPERNAEDRIDLSAGDNADATSQGASDGARGSEAGLGRHEDKTIEEDN
jgi:hypothetical protein